MRDPRVIHVVRHGRTRSNRVGLVMGWADESIEPDQHDAADAVAARLAAAPAPVRVVSSPLARARDTAAPLATALSVDLETDARLGELYQGPWQGLCKVAQDRAIGGPLLGPSAYFMKSPPIQYRDEEARELVDEFARRCRHAMRFPSGPT